MENFSISYIGVIVSNPTDLVKAKFGGVTIMPASICMILPWLISLLLSMCYAI